MLTSVRSALSSAKILGYSNSSAAHDIYEAYILTMLLRAAQCEGWQWDLRDQAGNVTTRAVFRMGPGKIASGNFTHVRLTKSGKYDLEAHIGVKVTGQSTVSHEFDLLLITKTDANACRTGQVDPSYTEVVGHAEAKYYGGNLSLPIGRSMVGLSVDCQLRNKSVLVTNQNGRTVESLIRHYGVAFRFLIEPSNPSAEAKLVQLFQNFLQAAP